jgi:hypothetical protein
MNRNWSNFTCRQLISFRLPLTSVKWTGRWKYHVHHWKIQIPPLQQLRRKLLNRCEWCGGKGTDVNTTAQWERQRSPFWQGERDLYHGECLSAKGAHRTCFCDDPIFDHDGWGVCGRCGLRRAYGWTPENLNIHRLYASVPTGERPSEDIRTKVEAIAAASRSKP